MIISKFVRVVSKLLLVIIIVIAGGILVYRYWWIPELKETFQKIKNINSIKYEYVDFTENGVLMKKKVWRKGQGNEMKIRIEDDYLGDGETEFITIFDFKEKVAYVYSPKNNIARKSIINSSPSESYAEGTEKDFLDEANWITSHHPIFLGKQSLDGKESLVVFCFDDVVKVKEWISKEYGIRIKGKELFSQEHHEWQRENLEINIDISDDIFNLPPGAEIISKE